MGHSIPIKVKINQSRDQNEELKLTCMQWIDHITNQGRRLMLGGDESMCVGELGHSILVELVQARQISETSYYVDPKCCQLHT